MRQTNSKVIGLIGRGSHPDNNGTGGGGSSKLSMSNILHYSKGHISILTLCCFFCHSDEFRGRRNVSVCLIKNVRGLLDFRIDRRFDR